jgi:hypothetical protein
VEERDEKKGSDPDIEAHRRPAKLKANEEAPKEAESGEAGSEDDVELHRRGGKATK